MNDPNSTMLQQFEGATITKIGITRGGRDEVPLFFYLTLRLTDGTERDLLAYTMSVGHEIHFRIDGMYVPSEELP